MKKWTVGLMALMAVLLVAPAAFAQGADQTGGGGKALAGIAVGFGMAIAAFGCGLAQGRIASAMILGLVFVETLVLFTLAMIALKV